MIEEVVEAFKLNKSQILCLVVNNASNMTKTAERLNQWHTPKNVNRYKKDYQWLKMYLDNEGDFLSSSALALL